MFTLVSTSKPEFPKVWSGKMCLQYARREKCLGYRNTISPSWNLQYVLEYFEGLKRSKSKDTFSTLNNPEFYMFVEFFFFVMFIIIL